MLWGAQSASKHRKLLYQGFLRLHSVPEDMDRSELYLGFCIEHQAKHNVNVFTDGCMDDWMAVNNVLRELNNGYREPNYVIKLGGSNKHNVPLILNTLKQTLAKTEQCCVVSSAVKTAQKTNNCSTSTRLNTGKPIPLDRTQLFTCT